MIPADAPRAQAITANRLDTGEVVFRDAQGGWATRLGDAERFTSAEEGEAELALAKSEARVVIDPYLIELRLEAAGPVPLSYRERVRALGPTIHPEMGKQAEGGAAVEIIQQAVGAARSSGRLGLIRRK